MNKVLALTLCCVLFASMGATRSLEQSKFTIDDATNILEELLDDSQHNLADLEANWAVQQPILQANIDMLQGQLNRKTEECHGLDGVLADHEAELDAARKYVAWLNKRVSENEQRIKEILAERCQQNTNHIEGLKNDKIALSLVEFLRSQIQNKDSFDFAQRKAFMNKLQSFLAVYHRGNLSELIQLQKQVASDYEVNPNTEVHSRTSEEIGRSHVDNDQAELNLDEFQNGQRKAWGDVRSELLDILSQLEQTIKDKIHNAQEDEIRASSAASDFKLKLEHEIEVYLGELAKWNANVTRLEGVVAQDQANVAQCRSEEATLQSQLESAHHDMEVATADYNHKHANFDDEIAVFQDVLAMYSASTSSNADDFKARADDYIDDGTFNNGDYNDREVPDIDLLNP